MCWRPRGRGVVVIIVLIMEEEGGVVRQGRGGHQRGQSAGLGEPGQDRIQRHKVIWLLRGSYVQIIYYGK